MNPSTQQLLDKLVAMKAFVKDYPKPGVVFLNIDALFNDPVSRKVLTQEVLAAVKSLSFDGVAGIASRGYLLSGMIANGLGDRGEFLVQKVKKLGDSHFVQIKTSTEYSSDALQVLKNTIRPGQQYLLTDDLIATGGSVMSAVNLIRSCGGVVNTVFVMTELTDFNARESLKQAGVELISLFKFSNQDLQELLIKQNTGQPVASSPVSSVSDAQSDCLVTAPSITNADGQAPALQRLIELKKKKPGRVSASQDETINSQPVHLYNQGCPIDKWGIDPETVAHNSFKVFGTGDPFAVISPKVPLVGADVIVHVGLEHGHYSSEALLQEALQLCRSAYEHGARTVTVALPETLHPGLNNSEFNGLLRKMFKASGAQKLYYYDQNYSGKLEARDLKVSTPKAEMDALEPKEKTHIILAGSANRPFAEKMAESLIRRGEKIKLYFAEGEGTQVKIPKDVPIDGAVVTIVESTRPNPDQFAASQAYQINGATSYFFETAMLASQAKKRGALAVNLVNPYQFSARSDKAEDNSKGRTGAYVQHNGLLLGAAGVQRFVTAECHDPHTLSGSYTGKKSRGAAVDAMAKMSIQLAHAWLNDPHRPAQGQLRLVLPDAGADKRTKALAEILQAQLGETFCQFGVRGEKNRDSHQDDSAVLSRLSSGPVGINSHDKYLITDDETATGNTLCQAITNLTRQGAKDISVIVVHNNMPLDWLIRQLCLARFLYLGVNDLHFSDTQEMGRFALNYEDLITHYAAMSQLPVATVEERVFCWFKENISKDFETGSEAVGFNRFKELMAQIKDRVSVHSMADEFANILLAQTGKTAVPGVEMGESVKQSPSGSGRYGLFAKNDSDAGSRVDQTIPDAGRQMSQFAQG